MRRYWWIFLFAILLLCAIAASWSAPATAIPPRPTLTPGATPGPSWPPQPTLPPAYPPVILPGVLK